MNTSREPDVIVVGGGLGGLSAAFALTRQGLRVRVLERARQFGEVGAGIQIAPNCTRILHEYPLRGGEMFNQVVVFESTRARAGHED